MDDTNLWVKWVQLGSNVALYVVSIIVTGTFRVSVGLGLNPQFGIPVRRRRSVFLGSRKLQKRILKDSGWDGRSERQ